MRKVEKSAKVKKSNKVEKMEVEKMKIEKTLVAEKLDKANSSVKTEEWKAHLREFEQDFDEFVLGGGVDVASVKQRIIEEVDKSENVVLSLAEESSEREGDTEDCYQLCYKMRTSTFFSYIARAYGHEEQNGKDLYYYIEVAISESNTFSQNTELLSELLRINANISLPVWIGLSGRFLVVRNSGKYKDIPRNALCGMFQDIKYIAEQLFVILQDDFPEVKRLCTPATEVC